MQRPVHRAALHIVAVGDDILLARAVAVAVIHEYRTVDALVALLVAREVIGVVGRQHDVVIDLRVGDLDVAGLAKRRGRTGTAGA
ncbi:hypothetical protein SDC9_105591 [bioreactor metagenome]|uniref:Uncharacterized protein n=1 Tax=bioreactor metagenome TaxID=1076179 RepID=A0A645B143_9ZZZZ